MTTHNTLDHVGSSVQVGNFSLYNLINIYNGHTGDGVRVLGIGWAAHHESLKQFFKMIEVLSQIIVNHWSNDRQ